MPATMMVYAGADQIEDDAENDDMPAVVAELAYDLSLIHISEPTRPY